MHSTFLLIFHVTQFGKQDDQKLILKILKTKQKRQLPCEYSWWRVCILPWGASFSCHKSPQYRSSSDGHQYPAVDRSRLPSVVVTCQQSRSSRRTRLGPGGGVVLEILRFLLLLPYLLSRSRSQNYILSWNRAFFQYRRHGSQSGLGNGFFSENV